MAAITFKGRHFQHDMILPSVRWDLGYSLSYRDIEENDGRAGFHCGSPHHPSLGPSLFSTMGCGLSTEEDTRWPSMEKWLNQTST